MYRREQIFLLADLDCFFVEVERLHRPELRGVPVVIGGRPVQRGIVSACSYEARAFGVRSGISMADAYRRIREAGQAPLEEGGQVRFLHEGLHGNYSMYSRQVQDIARAMSPVFHGKSVDEFELDLTGCELLFERQYGGIEAFAQELRRRVKQQVGLPLSAGIGPTRLVAKMASRRAKPDGVFRVLPHQVLAFLDPHDVQSVPGVGPVGATNLRAAGVTHVGQLLRMPPRELEQRFGIGMLGLVESLVGLRRCEPQPIFGHEDRGGSEGFEPMHRPSREIKSIGHENTFAEDQRDPRVIRRMLWRLSEDACRRLRARGMHARHVTVRIRYKDFSTHTHGRALPAASCSDRDVFELACRLFAEADRGEPIRLVGVRLEQLGSGPLQQTLFPPLEREQRFYQAVDQIRERHGKAMLLSGEGLNQIRSTRSEAANSTAGIKSGFLGMGA